MSVVAGLIFTGLFGVAGVAVLVISTWSMVQWCKMVRSYPRCKGTVTGIQEFPCPPHRSTWCLVIEYSVDGKQFVIWDKGVVSNSESKIGTEETVIYNPENPQEGYALYRGHYIARAGGILTGLLFSGFAVTALCKFFCS